MLGNIHARHPPGDHIAFTDSSGGTDEILVVDDIAITSSREGYVSPIRVGTTQKASAIAVDAAGNAGAVASLRYMIA